MRIKRISVKELFGISTFNYVIQLKSKERITIIHGPNGSGKTVLFKMISGLFNHNTFIFLKYPFREFRVDFEDNSYITAKREFNKKDKQYSFPIISYSKIPKELMSLDIDKDFLRRIPPSLRRRITEADYDEVIRFLSGDRQFDVSGSLSEFLFHFGDEILGERNREPEWLNSLSSQLDVDLIHTNRLLINKSDAEPGRRPSTITLAAIRENSRDLSSRIQDKILEADTQAKILDRTFPSRVVSNVVTDRKRALKYDAIRVKLEELEGERKRLIDAGLLEPSSQETEFQIPEQIAKYQQERTLRSVLTLYISDTENKLKVYQELADKIELFKDIIQGMLTYKNLHISKNGFDIKGDTGLNIPLEELSSGEQHMLVLIYNLLFGKQEKVDKLILIDEPEISLHLSWQKRFLDDLLRINKLSDFDVIIATHSPSIINGRLDLMIGIQGATGRED